MSCPSSACFVAGQHVVPKALPSQTRILQSKWHQEKDLSFGGRAVITPPESGPPGLICDSRRGHSHEDHLSLRVLSHAFQQQKTDRFPRRSDF
ncbi:hypothetical protein DTO164E3_6286 [Paecilomyces variotii]|nr:hypothetical protein DTO032I3_6530 [Paecilomyces variotii]KAJ9196486.1 hypothetical protein DTO164E3_6286 [Paecilomyces variotii]KAJ9220280.1 hypothetical protein DTO169C6_7439 [Paecilomyces variotii]KAJ9267992.1 hypothetical protein DTO195F2_326 [Paecilomyces variotii]KAJ9268374.1 hypothetical protein DTO212C5_5526 [Paecilomyces variotii]